LHLVFSLSRRLSEQAVKAGVGGFEAFDGDVSQESCAQ
jgi:hypothetical protein